MGGPFFETLSVGAPPPLRIGMGQCKARRLHTMQSSTQDVIVRLIFTPEGDAYLQAPTIKATILYIYTGQCNITPAAAVQSQYAQAPAY
jgi:hypothetical protein